MSDINRERQDAVRKAWNNEKARVREGKGTRDWSPSEQREIVAKGRASGYEGHHMKSVKEYPQHAGNPQNIQFLNRSEHINGAHKGNTQNATNGYYNPQTGQMTSFGNRSPQTPKTQDLSAPLTQRQQNLAVKREQARQQAARQAKAETKQSVSKMAANDIRNKGERPDAQQIVTSREPITPTTHSQKGMESMRKQTERVPTNTSTKSSHDSHNKGIEAMRQKASENQRNNNPSRSTNAGIKSYKEKANGKTASAGKGSMTGTARGSSASSGKSSTGQSSGSSQGR